MKPKIVEALIGPMPKGICDPLPKVVVTFDDGTVKELFDFLPDEISFRPEEFVGLTEEAAHKLKYDKDMKYLSC